MGRGTGKGAREERLPLVSTVMDTLSYMEEASTLAGRQLSSRINHSLPEWTPALAELGGTIDKGLSLGRDASQQVLDTGLDATRPLVLQIGRSSDSLMKAAEKLLTPIGKLVAALPVRCHVARVRRGREASSS